MNVNLRQKVKTHKWILTNNRKKKHKNETQETETERAGEFSRRENTLSNFIKQLIGENELLGLKKWNGNLCRAWRAQNSSWFLWSNRPIWSEETKMACGERAGMMIRLRLGHRKFLEGRGWGKIDKQRWVKVLPHWYVCPFPKA